MFQPCTSILNQGLCFSFYSGVGGIINKVQWSLKALLCRLVTYAVHTTWPCSNNEHGDFLVLFLVQWNLSGCSRAAEIVRDFLARVMFDQSLL